jgi:hypothetical protein
MKNLLMIGLIVVAFAANAETVSVKYRGAVDLATFDCKWIQRSSFINRLCYDEKERYVIVALNGTYYHYCEVPEVTISSWMGASSMGRFYNSYIKGRHDCRVNYMPAYSN